MNKAAPSLQLFFTCNNFLLATAIDFIFYLGWSDKDRVHVGEELSDVLIYLIELAEKCHIDLPSAVLQKFELNSKKYPPEKVYGSSKKYTDYISDDH